ncbi:MAG: GAF domain-containing protein, partial [Myxococcales bacterium]
MTTPRVPVQIPDRSARVQAALRFAAGAAPGGPLSSSLCFLCEQLALMTVSPIASVYVLEGGDELVLRGTWGYEREVLGEVRLKVGQGITGTAVETMRPVTVDDARVSDQFEYFPQLAEERFPAFLAVPLLSGGRPRGALVLQREAGPFSEEDVLIAVGATRALTALIETERPAGAHLLLHGEGNQRGRALGLAA